MFYKHKKITFHETLIQLSLRDIQETKIEMWSSILIELIIIYCVLFICVGSFSLFIYQKFNSFLNQSIDAEEKDEKEIQNIIYNIFSFFLSLVSMYFKNYLNYVIIKNFNKSNNKRKFLFLIFLIYIIFLYYFFYFSIIV